MFNTLPTGFRHYEVLKPLGRGGFAVVYLARDMNLHVAHQQNVINMTKLVKQITCCSVKMRASR